MTLAFGDAAEPGAGLAAPPTRPPGLRALPSAGPAGAARAAAATGAATAPSGPPAGLVLLVAGIGEMVLTGDPAVGLVAYGLGSCIALSAWDPRTRTAALAHFMLPTGAAAGATVKFVDSGLPAFLDAFAARGGSVRGAQFKAAGGAAMLAINAGTLEIGRRNAEAVQIGLAARGLRLVATDFGGSSGRTVQLEVADGRLHIKSVARTAVL